MRGIPIQAILKAIWVYGVQLWDTASNSKKYYKDFKIGISESFENIYKIL